MKQKNYIKKARTIVIAILLLAYVIVISGCSGGIDLGKKSASDETTTIVKEETETKTLVVYFSYSGNTENLARQINEIVSGDIFKIETVKPYPTDYGEMLDIARGGYEGYLNPELKRNVDNIEDYSTIYIGSPVWSNTIAHPVMKFLENHNLKGKSVIPFVTHGGSGGRASFSKVKELATGAVVLEGFAIRGGDVDQASEKLNEWIK